MRGLTTSAILLVLVLSAPAVAYGGRPAEASFLVNLFRFVEWPHATNTATICFLHPSDVQGRLESGIANHERWAQLPGRTVIVKTLSDPHSLMDPAANEGCQILYLDARTADRLWPFPIPPALLTVSNQRDFAFRNGGMIQFIWDASDVYRIAIHPENVARSGLIVSGALGTLADRVDSARFAP